jgi:hypothetical protein
MNAEATLIDHEFGTLADMSQLDTESSGQRAEDSQTNDGDGGAPPADDHEEGGSGGSSSSSASPSGADGSKPLCCFSGSSHDSGN